MMNRWTLYSLIAVLTATPAISQIVPSKSPCGVSFCPSSQAATLNAAYLSTATSDAQREKMTAIIASHTSGGTVDWAASVTEYFDWRKSGLTPEQRADEEGRAKLARDIAEKTQTDNAKAAAKQSSQALEVMLKACVDDLIGKNYNQPNAPEDIARAIIVDCALQAERRGYKQDASFITMIDSGYSTNNVAAMIRELKRPRVQLNR